MVSNRSAFKTYATLIVPDRHAVLSNLNNGSSGRDIADAVFDGRIADVKRMIENDSRLITTMTAYDDTAFDKSPPGQYGDLLTFAVGNFDIDMVDALFNLGMPPNGYQIGCALQLALMADRPELAQLLLSRGASPDPQKLGGENVMHEVIAYGNLGAAMMLLRYKLDINWVDPMGVGHLQTAMNMDQYQIADLIAAAGANLWQVAGDGAMPVQDLIEPISSERKADTAVREQLVMRAKKPGLPWPPPKFSEVREKVLTGIWPTSQMYAAGMRVTPQSLVYMKRHFGPSVH
jgi:hypothetical protein